MLCSIVCLAFSGLLFSQENTTNFLFYGKEVSCYLNMNDPIGDSVEINSFWNSLKTHDQQIIDSLYSKKEQYNLNDWGFYMLVKSTIEQSISNEQLAFIATCYYLNRAGYRSKIALSQSNKIILLLQSDDLILSSDIVNDGKYNYYVFGNENGESLSVLEMDYREDGKGLSLNFDVPVNLSGATLEKQLKFWYKCRRYKLSISLDSSLIAFYNDYPQMDLGNYFNTPISSNLEESLFNALWGTMVEKTEIEKAKYLLKFCQKAFKHKKDIRAYGESRSLFCEETLFYPFSDCEDRAILYAQLIKLFTDIPVIGVCYPEHVVTAIAIDDDRPNLLFNKSIDRAQERYFHADPTSKGLKIGHVRPKFSNRTPRIIEID